MKFNKVIGQKEIKEYLIDTVKQNKISHALLLYGAHGTGKIALAIAFAQYLSCTDRLDYDSCGTCKSCKKYEKLIHPDLHFVFPVISASGKKSISDTYIQNWRELILTDPYFSLNEWLGIIANENKQASIFAEESSEIIKKLNLKTFESDFKCMIIWLPEKMNTSCANKLLKILEEPPDSTVFMLVSDDRQAILPTILSRTQALKIPGIDNESMISALSNEFDLEPERLNDICKLSRGSFLKAKNYIIASEETQYNFEQFVAIMRFAYRRNIDEAINWAGEIAKIGREKQKSFCKYALRFLRENFIYDIDNRKISYLFDLEKDFAKNFTAFVSEKNIYDLAEQFEKAHYHIERNANAKILFTDLTFKIMKSIRKI